MLCTSNLPPACGTEARAETGSVAGAGYNGMLDMTGIHCSSWTWLLVDTSKTDATTMTVPIPATSPAELRRCGKDGGHKPDVAP
mmetsp:Transcript_2661/g.6357  ORF Transcript_2661/g.6357 Transcript_2661/m.6357 type:complete len:84 (-) Transcript_2661:26-277(-)